MSTIEEARVQAREALMKYYTVSTQGYGAGEHQNLSDALRALSGGWQDATAELHATQARLREAEAVIAKELSRHREKHGETPRFVPDDYQHELEPTHWEPYVICDACGTFWPCKTTQTLVYKPTNQEKGEET